MTAWRAYRLSHDTRGTHLSDRPRSCAPEAATRGPAMHVPIIDSGDCKKERSL